MSSGYRLIDVIVGDGRCDNCGRPVKRSAIVLDPDGGRLWLGFGCSFKLAGIKPTDRPEPPEVDDRIGELPDWMLSL